MANLNIDNQLNFNNNCELNQNNNIKFILSENKDDYLKNLDNKIIDEYIEDLCSLGISKLNEQKKILEKEENDSISSIKHVILKNYNSVINSSFFVNELDKDTQVLQKNLNFLIDTIPIFSHKVNIFSQEAENISIRWRNASLMLNKHGRILEFLEILQLFDSCIRNGLYDQTLKLLNYVEELNKKHKSIKIIADLGNKINEWKEIMATQLIKDLYNNDSLDSYKKSISYLRTLDIFEESEIRLKFLMAKNNKMQSSIKELNKQNTIDFLIKLIDIYEKNILEIFFQYNFLFINKNNINVKKEKYVDFDESSILISWIVLKINNFEKTFKLNLLNISNNNDFNFFKIAPLFDHCFKFSESLSNIGLDLKFIFKFIFDNYLINDVKKCLDKSIKKFESNLDNYNITISTNIDSEKLDFENNFTLTSLKNFLPLKELCNDILNELDKLLLFISFNSILQIKYLLEEYFIKTSSIIQKYLRSEILSLNSNEKEMLISFKDEYENHILLHIQNCFEKIFLNLDITQTFGLQSFNFINLNNCNKLNMPLPITFNL